MNTRVLRYAAIVVVLAFASIASACSSDDGGDTTDGGGGATPADTSGALSITAEDFRFSPSSLTVPSGESSITVTNEGSVEHSFTLDDDSVSEDIEPGDSVTVTVDLTADAGFHCEYHPDQMTGTLSVG
ncbi:MAG TPA: cupredoxin domain-containing protein [Actinomycetota bacterium]